MIFNSKFFTIFLLYEDSDVGLFNIVSGCGCKLNYWPVNAVGSMISQLQYSYMPTRSSSQYIVLMSRPNTWQEPKDCCSMTVLRCISTLSGLVHNMLKNSSTMRARRSWKQPLLPQLSTPNLRRSLIDRSLKQKTYSQIAL